MKALSLPCPAQVPASDWRRATEYTAALISRRVRLLPWWADREQVELEGWLALWKAGQDWDPRRGVSLVTWVGSTVPMRLLTVLRDTAPGGQHHYRRLRMAGEHVAAPVSLDEPDASWGRRGDHVPAPVPQESTLPRYWLLAALVLQDLTAEEQAVLLAVAGEGLSYADTGRRLDLTEHQAKRRFEKARDRLEEMAP